MPGFVGVRSNKGIFIFLYTKNQKYKLEDNLERIHGSARSHSVTKVRRMSRSCSIEDCREKVPKGHSMVGLVFRLDVRSNNTRRHLKEFISMR
jgi:uncharacterized protein YbcC (UPF0753/DUF2309 family)